MEETPHIVAHFMAAGAEKRLEDYHFLRSTYDTISSQEVQLNRILRMMGEDEINLTWREDILPIGRARSRFPFELDRTANTFVLQGSIAYERLRDLDPDSPRHGRQMTPSVSTRRSHEFRDRRQNWSEQREISGSSSNTPSASRLQALAEFDAAMAESEAKRQRQAEENRLNSANNNNDREGVGQGRRRVIDDNNQTDQKKQKQSENQSNETIDKNAANSSKTNEEKQNNEDVNQSKDLSNESKQQERLTVDFGRFSVRCNPVPTSVRLKNNEDKFVRLTCQWSPVNSSSPIDFYTVERQIENGEWTKLGENIQIDQNQTQIDFQLSTENEQKGNSSAHFRLTAHFKNGQTVSSQPTDEVLLKFSDEPSIIVPDVEILSEKSAKLTWDKEQISNATKPDEKLKENYDVEKKENENDWQKVQQVSLSADSTQVDDLNDSSSTQFRLVPSESTSDEKDKDVFTVHDINQWLNSLNVSPTSPTTIDVQISPEAFQQFGSYQVEFTQADQTDKWQKISDITQDSPKLTIDKLKQDTDYKFRFTPVSSVKDVNASQFSVVLDVKTLPKRKGRFDKEVKEKPKAPPPQFNIEQIDEQTVVIEAIVPKDQPATFEDVYDVYSKKGQDETNWNKVASIDKDHLTAKIDGLEESSIYAFKIKNAASSSEGNGSEITQQFQIETKPAAPKFNPNLFLEKIEASLENVVNGVMKAAAGHKVVEEPFNVSLNEVIREVFRDENLVPNEQYGFDALSLSNDLQLYRGPKQMMLNELEGEETIDVSKHYGEIIIHNYRNAQQTPGSVVVKEENGNTRVANIDGDVIIRNVVSDVLLTNEQTRHQLSMNIVGQAFLKGVQGTLIASKFKGIIVVKSVNMP